MENKIQMQSIKNLSLLGLSNNELFLLEYLFVFERQGIQMRCIYILLFLVEFKFQIPGVDQYIASLYIGVADSTQHYG